MDIEVFPTIDQINEAIALCSSFGEGPPIDSNDLLNTTTKSATDCSLCGKKMANRNACRMHMEKTHRVFNKVKTLEEILGVKDKLGKSDRKNLRLFCPIENCHGTRIFGSTKTLIQHFQKFHQEKLISCEKCATKFSLLRDLKYHQKRFCPFREKSSALESSCKNSNEHVKKLAKTNPSRQTGELTRNATFVLNLTAVSKHLLTPLAKKKPATKTVFTQTETTKTKEIGTFTLPPVEPSCILDEEMLQITQNSNSHFAPQTFGHQQHGGIVDGIVEVRPPMQHSFSQTSYPQTSDFGMITEDYNYFSSFDGLTNFQGGLPHVSSFISNSNNDWRHCGTQTPVNFYAYEEEGGGDCFFNTTATQTIDNQTSWNNWS